MQAEADINVYSSHCCACTHARWAVLPTALPGRSGASPGQDDGCPLMQIIPTLHTNTMHSYRYYIIQLSTLLHVSNAIWTLIVATV